MAHIATLFSQLFQLGLPVSALLVFDGEDYASVVHGVHLGLLELVHAADAAARRVLAAVGVGTLHRLG